jgi:hypothetical protein
MGCRVITGCAVRLSEPAYASAAAEGEAQGEIRD